MVKVNELRIGNLMYSVNLLGDKKELYEITPRFFCSIANGQSWEDQKKSGKSELSPYMQPIELTNHWIELLGFKEKGTHYHEIPNNHILELRKTISNLGVYYTLITKRLVEPRTAIGQKIEYVHQLQNLYFALTGEELQIK